ncbi:MAG: glycosyltransferase [Patescibacteria group bacterium]
MRIWLCYVRAGGGHKAPAEALASEFRKSYPGEKVELVDLAEKAELFFRYAIDDGYALLVHRAPWLYSFLYELNKIRSVVRFQNKLVDYFTLTSIKAKLVLDRPDAIVATHFFVSSLIRAMAELKISIPITVAVTEPFSAPSPWFFFPEINYVVYSEQAKKLALAGGVPESNIKVLPPIINHQLVKLDESAAALVKEKHGLAKEKKTILIIGGGNGLPGGVGVIAAILKDSIDANLLIVCGNNKNFEGKVRALVDRYPGRAVVLGYVKDVSELIAVSDLVIGKAGAGVVFETLMNRKPLLITHYIYGQEKGTMEFVVKNNLGWYEPRPAHIAQKVRDCLGQAELDRISLSHRTLQLAPGNSKIADYLLRNFKERVSAR